VTRCRKAVCKKCVPSDLLEKLYINNKQILLESSRILAVRLSLFTIKLLEAFRIKSDKQQGYSALLAFVSVVMCLAFSAFPCNNGQDKTQSNNKLTILSLLK